MSDGADNSVSQTVIAGTLGAPVVFSILLIINAVLLGVGIGRLSGMITAEENRSHDTNTRLMLLSNDIRDVESVLISRGYAKPADFTKPSDVGQQP